ncbi:MAG: hypothetical protein HN531_02265 [Opitutae bacterium]|nr:hypothetical protein [Opitutae bacterium]
MSKRAIFIRSGGLGDFVLSLPVLNRALVSYDETILFTRTSYHSLVSGYSDSLTLKDIDSDLDTLSQVLPDSDVITFWQDEEWKRELRNGGCGNLYFLEPRPTGNAHFSAATFSKLGWDWLEEYSRRAWLGDHWVGGDALLWVHPGSGSDKKNVPLPCFAELARKWLDSKTVNRVAFSFGEADAGVLSNFENLEISEDRRVQVVRSVNLGKLRKMMVDQASVFLGNDSGPGHLAASLGIPTHIVFRSTERKIWAPLGPRVETYESFSEASKIL